MSNGVLNPYINTDIQLFLAETVVYIVLFGFFSSYPLIFAKHGLSDSLIGLTLLPIILGFLALIPINYLQYGRFRRMMAKDPPADRSKSSLVKKIVPEERLLICQWQWACLSLLHTF